MRLILAVLAIVVAASSCSSGRNYPPRTFTWTGDVTPGASVIVHNIDGTIAVVPSDDGKVTVDAVIVNAAPSAIVVKQVMSGDNVVFCTMLSSTGGSCDEGNVRMNTRVSPFSFFSRRHTLTVRYTLRVPAGVKVDVQTVNGKIAAQNIAGNVKAETVNGDVIVSTTSGTVNAETVNGSIIASMASLPDSGNVHLETVNGSITSLIPEGIGGRIDLENANGSITANYPNAVPDSADKHHLRIKLDEGARRVHLETVNGSVNLTRYAKPATVSLLR